ncbi:MAG TPA: sigma-70 family RNA polymerase sigma factor [Parapedobacter sp.]|uniref:RNA polymerase sigma factor n=1 Tax=Parapedobacter sp. TaxID=1958893 RepID=UPI002C8454E0|nr:sigma-70 family RNA polymerase sigma factor [Parapedobacter sp.]HWK56581.1 sigma-70 family RNA polymerase sigma factor [Parapedobacter sp.]
MDNYAEYTDEDLVPLLKEGHQGAFSCIYERYWHALYQTAYRRLANREQCSDVVQDVFIDLWEHRGNKSIQRLEPYLHTAVRYKIYTLLAKGKALPAFVEPFEQMLVSPFTADGPFGEQETRRLLTAWLETLPRKRRRIFEMHYFEGRNTKEIAEELQVSQKTVQNQLNTASNSLRALLIKTVIMGLVFLN